MKATIILILLTGILCSCKKMNLAPGSGESMVNGGGTPLSYSFFSDTLIVSSGYSLYDASKGKVTESRFSDDTGFLFSEGGGTYAIRTSGFTDAWVEADKDELKITFPAQAKPQLIYSYQDDQKMEIHEHVVIYRGAERSYRLIASRKNAFDVPELRYTGAFVANALTSVGHKVTLAVFAGKEE